MLDFFYSVFYLRFQLLRSEWTFNFESVQYAVTASSLGVAAAYNDIFQAKTRCMELQEQILYLSQLHDLSKERDARDKLLAERIVASSYPARQLRENKQELNLMKSRFNADRSTANDSLATAAALEQEAAQLREEIATLEKEEAKIQATIQTL